MVYVYSKQSELNKYIGKNLSVEEIKNTLSDLGMDIKGETSDNDPELKIEITAEKLDMISTVGIARAIKYYLGLETQFREYKLEKSNIQVIVDKSVEGIRPKTVAAVLKDVPITQEFLDEMIKIQEKIHDSFGRGRKKAAIGIYPLEKISPPIHYKAKKPSQIKFRPLEFETELTGDEILDKHDTGKKYSHLLKGKELYPIFEDSNKNILSMPPIINSHQTGRVEITSKDLFIECSGNNLQHLDNILKVLITTFIEMGAKVQTVDVIYPDFTYTLNLKPISDEIELNYINSLIGINIKEKDLPKLFTKVMYKFEEIKNGKIKLKIPAFKSDVWNDCDIADDIARAYGYNNISVKFPNIASIGKSLDFNDFKDRITKTLVSMQFLETYTYMLTSTKDQFDKMNLNIKDYDFIKLIDSADEGINMIRLQILPESLKTLNINRKNKYPQKIFENGFTILTDNNQDVKAKNQSNLCVCIADLKANYTQIKNILDSVMQLNEIEFEVEEKPYPFLIEGRSAKILVKGNEVGFIGEIHPQILENFGLIVPVVTFEINLDKIYSIFNQ